MFLHVQEIQGIPVNVSLRTGADCFPFSLSLAAFGLFGECRHRRIGRRGSQPHVLGEAFTAGSVQETFRSLMSTSPAADAAIHDVLRDDISLAPQLIRRPVDVGHFRFFFSLLIVFVLVLSVCFVGVA